MKMDGLIDLYTSMKEKGLDHTAFDYIHNNIKLYIFFDIVVHYTIARNPSRFCFEHSLRA